MSKVVDVAEVVLNEGQMKGVGHTGSPSSHLSERRNSDGVNCVPTSALGGAVRKLVAWGSVRL